MQPAKFHLDKLKLYRLYMKLLLGVVDAMIIFSRSFFHDFFQCIFEVGGANNGRGSEFLRYLFNVVSAMPFFVLRVRNTTASCFYPALKSAAAENRP